MRQALVEPGMKTPEKSDVVQARNGGGEGRTNRSELETSSSRADSKRISEFRSAIEASTARIMSIAITRGTDLDPEAA